MSKDIKDLVKKGRPKKGEEDLERSYKSSVVKLNKKHKALLTTLAKDRGLSVAQLMLIGAQRAMELDTPSQLENIVTLQLRIPKAVHAELKRKSDATGIPMTDLMLIGLEAELGVSFTKE